MAGGSKRRGKRNRNVSFQYGGGQTLSMPNLAGNFHFKRKTGCICQIGIWVNWSR